MQCTLCTDRANVAPVHTVLPPMSGQPDPCRAGDQCPLLPCARCLPHKLVAALWTPAAVML